MEPEVFAVSVSCPFCEFAKFQVGEPEVCELGKGTRRVQLSSVPVAGPRQQLLAQPSTRGRGRGCGCRHAAQPSIGIAEPGLGHHTLAAATCAYRT